MTVPWRAIAVTFSPELDRFYGANQDFRFTASEAEAYDVAGACVRLSDAVLLLQRGLRSGDAARDYLQSRGLDRLIGDGPDLLPEALGKGVRFEDLVRHAWITREDKPVECRIGALRFAASSLDSSVHNESVATRILNGQIDFEDIKAIGIGRLKGHDRILHFAPLLEKAHAGEPGYSVEAIRALAVRLDTDEAEHLQPLRITFFANLVSPEVAVDLPLRVADRVCIALPPGSRPDDPEARAKALYYARFFHVAGIDLDAAREFYHAGVPVETAIAVHAVGASAEQGIAVHRGDVAAPLSDGFL